MKRAIAAILVLAFAGMLGAGCGDISAETFMPAFPDENTLTIKTQNLDKNDSALSSLSQALVGDRAELHDLSFLIAFQINVHAGIVLLKLWFITRFEPALIVEEDGVFSDGDYEFHYNAHAVWGPFKDNQKNLEYILHVYRGTDSIDDRTTFWYYGAGRPIGADDNSWVIFLKGGAKPFENGMPRQGMVQIDMDAVRTLDPDEESVGVATFVYEKGADYRAVAAVGEGVWSDSTHTAKTDATYFYGHSADGYTVMEFDIDGDMAEVDGNALENFHITTGWLYNGDGRSDAMVSGGDLNDGEASLTECWARDLRQTYYKLDITGDPPIEDGSVEDCFTPDPIELPEIDYDAIRNAFE
jgi:hypothetical protein